MNRRQRKTGLRTWCMVQPEISLLIFTTVSTLVRFSLYSPSSNLVSLIMARDAKGLSCCREAQGQGPRSPPSDICQKALVVGLSICEMTFEDWAHVDRKGSVPGDVILFTNNLVKEVGNQLREILVPPLSTFSHTEFCGKSHEMLWAYGF